LSASFLAGLVIGFSIAAPVGPIGLLCIQRTLARGRTSGFVSGLGAATADAIYGAIVGFGLTVVSTVLVSQQIWIRLGGGVFLIYLGARIFLSTPSESKVTKSSRSLVKDYATTLALTLANPITVISFLALLGGLGLVGRNSDYAATTKVVSGVFAGSVLWWFVLSAGVGAFRDRFRKRGMRWVNRVSGGLIAIFGLVALLS
jgi:threonine/homoserine/homoserine lactone efflux protein